MLLILTAAVAALVVVQLCLYVEVRALRSDLWSDWELENGATVTAPPGTFTGYPRVVQNGDPVPVSHVFDWEGA